MNVYIRPHTLYPELFVSPFLCLLKTSRVICHLPTLHIYSYLKPLLFFHEANEQTWYWCKALSTEGLPSPTSFGATGRLYCDNDPFSTVSVYIANLSVSQAQIFSSIAGPLCVNRCELGERHQCKVVGNMEVWATSFFVSYLLKLHLGCNHGPVWPHILVALIEPSLW